MADLKVVDGTAEEIVKEISQQGPVRIPCCFCGEDMEAPSEEGQIVIVFPSPHENEHLEQTWFCHLICFREKLHPDFRVFRTEWFEFLEERDADLQ